MVWGNRKFFRVILCTVFFLTMAAVYSMPAEAELGDVFKFSGPDVSSRAMGMGGAFTGTADDVSALKYNPAGIGQQSSVDVYGSGGLYTLQPENLENLWYILSELEDDPENDLSEIQSHLENISQLTAGAQFFGGVSLGSFAGAIRYHSSYFADQERQEDDILIDNPVHLTGVLGMGQEILTPALDIGALAYGVNLRMGQSSLTRYQLIMDEDQQDAEMIRINAEDIGYALDAGLMIKFTDLVQGGLMVSNLLASEYELAGEKAVHELSPEGHWTEISRDDYSFGSYKPERKVRAGASFYVPVLAATIAADVDNLLGAGESGQVLHLGMEKNIFLNALSIRGGLVEGAEDRFFTTGLGLNFLPLNLDTALMVDDSFSESVFFSLSANMKF